MVTLKRKLLRLLASPGDIVAAGAVIAIFSGFSSAAKSLRRGGFGEHASALIPIGIIFAATALLLFVASAVNFVDLRREAERGEIAALRAAGLSERELGARRLRLGLHRAVCAILLGTVLSLLFVESALVDSVRFEKGADAVSHTFSPLGLLLPALICLAIYLVIFGRKFENTAFHLRPIRKIAIFAVATAILGGSIALPSKALSETSPIVAVGISLIYIIILLLPSAIFTTATVSLEARRNELMRLRLCGLTEKDAIARIKRREWLRALIGIGIGALAGVAISLAVTAVMLPAQPELRLMPDFYALIIVAFIPICCTAGTESSVAVALTSEEREK